MNHTTFGLRLRYLKCFVFSSVCLLPVMASAHPGHYHPDETDEFDFFTAALFHSHGPLECGLALLVIINLLVACMNQKLSVRFSALTLAIASLSVISAL